ncbi:MAG: aspartate--tRNA ligase [Patescibacteria group bacterium]|nr:aspartate--tRNA ligase [Patescibacteria group bacterium]
MFRSHTCGALRKTDAGKTVTLSGWVNSRRDHGGVIFLDLRDRYGLTQVTCNPKLAQAAWEVADKVRDEFVIKITGKVSPRPEDMVNPKLTTGEVEVFADDVEILNPSKTPPFTLSWMPDADGKAVDPSQEVNEDIRLKYRFLDLRRHRMLENLEFRAKVIKFLRDWMHGRGFLEVDTPLLTASSPEGARDFLVPSRLHPGKFYALPQAPQQYKQLLMVGGIDKYFQIAPCMRDEDARADRSPGEFYQLDIETSFLTQDEFFDLMEPLFIDLSKAFTKKKVPLVSSRLPRLTYAETMLKYGTDKPDLRFGMEIADITALVKGCGFSVFANAVKSGGVVRALCALGAAKLSRTEIEKMTDEVKKLGAKGLAYIICKPDGSYQSPIVKFLGEELTTKIVKEVSAKPGDVIFFGADTPKIVAAALGSTRLTLGKRLDLIDKNQLAFCWIVDFPMYEWSEQDKKIDFCHNPFSMPQGGMKALKEQKPLDILAYQYDIVCNGIELSSGAVRNNVPEIMYEAFKIAGYGPEVVDKKFGHMIAAFKYGAPPHCGFAPGIERMVMILREEQNIREITAFPKNGRAEDAMMNAPSEVEPKQLKELHLKIVGK